MLMNCDISRISMTEDFDPKPGDDDCNPSDSDRAVRLLKKIEGASRIQSYLIDIVLPTSSESKKRVVLNDIRNLSKYIHSISQDCQGLVTTSSSKRKAHPSSKIEVSELVSTPTRTETKSYVSTPGSFDRLLAKLISPTKGATPPTSHIKGHSQSCFSPSTPPQRNRKEHKGVTDGIVLKSVEDWAALNSYGGGCSPSMDERKGIEHSTPSDESAHIQTPGRKASEEFDVFASPDITESATSSPVDSGKCTLNVCDAPVDDPDGVGGSVRVLFTMRAQPSLSATTSPPPPSRTALEKPAIITPELTDSALPADADLLSPLESPSSPPPPPPLSDNSEKSRGKWSPASEALHREVCEDSQSFSPLMGEVVLGGQSLFDQEVCSPAPSPPPADLLCSPSYVSSPESAVGPLRSTERSMSDEVVEGGKDESVEGDEKEDLEVCGEQTSYPPVQSTPSPTKTPLRSRARLAVGSISPVRAGAVAGGGAVVVKVQRSSEWTPGEISSVFHHNQKPRSASESLGGEAAGGLHSQWMRRPHRGPRCDASGMDHSRLQHGPARGDGLPPNKLNLRQSWQLAQKGGSGSANQVM